MNQRNKGQSVLLFPDEYVMIDTETTGLSPEWDRVIEISALKVADGAVVSEFSALVKYAGDNEVAGYITALTGITTAMIQESGLDVNLAISAFKEFVGDALIAGYNVNFDINFIYDLYQTLGLGAFSNDYLDVLRISRRFFYDERHNRVADVLPRLGINHAQEHRSLADCVDQMHILEEIRRRADAQLLGPRPQKVRAKLDLSQLVREQVPELSETCFTNRNVCFTGTLNLRRAEAAQLVVNLGGRAQNGVNKKTDYLVVGDTSYRLSIGDGVTGKMKKALELQSAGQDITILTESLFMELVEDDND